MHHYVHQETSFGRQDRTTPCNRQEIKGGWGSSIKPKDRRLSVKRRRVRSNARPAYFTLSVLFDLACFCPRPVKRLTTSRTDKINPMHSQSIIYRNSSTARGNDRLFHHAAIPMPNRRELLFLSLSCFIIQFRHTGYSNPDTVCKSNSGRWRAFTTYYIISP